LDIIYLIYYIFPRFMAKIVLAFSGGLDTSVILKWLVEKGHEVVAYVADVGQKEDFSYIKHKALLLGASKVYIEDLKEEFVTEYIFPALKAGAVYEGRYLLGTALARPLIAKKQVEIAKKEGTKVLAHGCTGKGNDQVRFELTWLKFMPDATIVSPWKDKEFITKFKGRLDLIKYAKANGIPVSSTPNKPFSMDENIAHTSYESGILEDPKKAPPSTMFKGFVLPQNAPDKETKLIIEFAQGVPIKVVNLESKREINGALKLFEYLNMIGSKNGIGMVDMVENRFIGIKSRGVYVAPAATILWAAHKDLESITLDKEVLHLKELFAPIIGTLIYNGLWYSPEMEVLMAAIQLSQKGVLGKVFITLYKGNVIITGRQSENSLYHQGLASMNEHGDFNPEHSEGFIKTLALRLMVNGK